MTSQHADLDVAGWRTPEEAAHGATLEAPPPSWLTQPRQEKRELQIMKSHIVLEGDENTRFLPAFTTKVEYLTSDFGPCSVDKPAPYWPVFTAADGVRCRHCCLDVIGPSGVLVRHKDSHGYHCEFGFCLRGTSGCALAWRRREGQGDQYEKEELWTREVLRRYLGIRSFFDGAPSGVFPQHGGAWTAAMCYGEGVPEGTVYKLRLQSVPTLPMRSFVEVKRYCASLGEKKQGMREMLPTAITRGLVSVNDPDLPFKNMSHDEASMLSRTTDLRRPMVRSTPIQQRQPTDEPPVYLNYIATQHQPDGGKAAFDCLPGQKVSAKEHAAQRRRKAEQEMIEDQKQLDRSAQARGTSSPRPPEPAAASPSESDAPSSGDTSIAMDAQHDKQPPLKPAAIPGKPPKPAKATKVPKAPKAPKAPKIPKAPKAPKAPKPPKAPKNPAAQAQKETSLAKKKTTKKSSKPSKTMPTADHDQHRQAEQSAVASESGQEQGQRTSRKKKKPSTTRSPPKKKAPRETIEPAFLSAEEAVAAQKAGTVAAVPGKEAANGKQSKSKRHKKVYRAKKAASAKGASK